MDVLAHREGGNARPFLMAVLRLEDAVALVAAQRAAGRRIVFTNGVYDLLHPGHVRYLRAARAEGDTLIVGVNSDRSVRANKGPGRPVNPEHERAELIAALAAVDAAVVFDEDTPHAIVSALQPDVLVKGADWPADQIVGRDVVEARGGRVVRIPVEEGHSSSGLIDRIRQAPGLPDPQGRPRCQPPPR
jgi:D-beta-D-heptose 7-phosphate kinase/D-beta-D-heptose 1-phosphate adenosyltransferase